MITILAIMGVESKDSMTYAAIIAVGALDLLKIREYFSPEPLFYSMLIIDVVT
jgi:hypothetical protein